MSGCNVMGATVVPYIKMKWLERDKHREICITKKEYDMRYTHTLHGQRWKVVAI